MNNKRMVRVQISQELWVEMVRQDWTTGDRIITCTEGLPVDAIFAGSTFDPLDMSSYLFFTHPTFAEVLEGQPVPLFSVAHSYTRRVDEADDAREKV